MNCRTTSCAQTRPFGDAIPWGRRGQTNSARGERELYWREPRVCPHFGTLMDPANAEARPLGQVEWDTSEATSERALMRAPAENRRCLAALKSLLRADKNDQ